MYYTHICWLDHISKCVIEQVLCDQHRCFLGFGIGGMILDGLYIAEKFEDYGNPNSCHHDFVVATYIVKMIFAFSQLYFVFNNAEVSLFVNTVPGGSKSGGLNPRLITQKWMNEWMNEWINESINQWINQINQSINQSINRSIDQSIYQTGTSTPFSVHRILYAILKATLPLLKGLHYN